MKLLPFNNSEAYSIGVELELQIINPQNGNLVERAKDLIRSIRDSNYTQHIKPEITQSTIELNSSCHSHPQTLFNELIKIRNYLKKKAKELNILFAGGGTHSFQLWRYRKIFPTLRFKNIWRDRGYLAKEHTVFGQHIHIGCTDSQDAIYLTQMLARYIPQFIALSASSPFYQGIDTSFDSARLNIYNNLYTHGFMPQMHNWYDFSKYFRKLKRIHIIKSMKDIYWDVRPKGEFGTVEIRICDTPLTLEGAVLLAAYAQTLAHYLLTEHPRNPISYDPIIYNYNRFQATRHAFDATFIHPYKIEPRIIGDDILNTIQKLKSHAHELDTSFYISKIKKNILNKRNDAKRLRERFEKLKDFHQLSLEQARIWMEK